MAFYFQFTCLRCVASMLPPHLLMALHETTHHICTIHTAGYYNSMFLNIVMSIEIVVVFVLLYYYYVCNE